MGKYLSFSTSIEVALIVFGVMLVALFFQYLLSGGKIGQLKTTWTDHIISIVFCAICAGALFVPGCIYIIMFVIAIGAAKYVIPKLKSAFTSQDTDNEDAW